jgi:hypothetical protein
MKTIALKKTRTTDSPAAARSGKSSFFFTSRVAACALFLAMASLPLFAKSFDITFSAPAVLGSATVPAGQYSLKFDGAKVTLTNASSGKKFDTVAVVQNGSTKFANTIVQAKRVEGQDLVDEIQLGGTSTALDFKH